MILWTLRGYKFSPVEEKVPRRSVSRSASSAASMARSMGTWNVALIW